MAGIRIGDTDCPPGGGACQTPGRRDSGGPGRFTTAAGVREDAEHSIPQIPHQTLALGIFDLREQAAALRGNADVAEQIVHLVGVLLQVVELIEVPDAVVVRVAVAVGAQAEHGRSLGVVTLPEVLVEELGAPLGGSGAAAAASARERLPAGAERRPPE